MNQRFPILAELMRALVVLALVLLNLSAATPAMATAPGYHPSKPVWQCGFADPPDHAVHAPCHACRTGADAVLPPPPSLAERVCLRPTGIFYRPVSESHPFSFRALAHRSRGPPPHA